VLADVAAGDSAPTDTGSGDAIVDTGVDTGSDASDGSACPGVLCNGMCMTDCSTCLFGNVLCPADGTCYSGCTACAGMPFNCNDQSCVANCLNNCSGNIVDCYSCPAGVPTGRCGLQYALNCPTPRCGCDASADCPGSYQYCTNTMTCDSCGESPSGFGFICQNAQPCQPSTATCHP
jgi:hypothetical protein